MRSKLKRGIILSAELSTLTKAENDRRTRELYCDLEEAGVKFKPVIGWYKGVQEKSFFVEVESDDTLLGVRALAFLNYKQESVLLLNEKREATLHYRDHSTEKIGNFTNVSAEEAGKVGASTYCPKLDQYWICK